LQVGRTDEAIAEAKRAVELDPLDLKYSDSLGVMYRDSRRYDLAIEQFQKNLEMDPSYAPSTFNLAYTYQRMGKYDLWIQEWKKAAVLGKDPDDVTMAELAARTYPKSGYKETIRRLLELRMQWSQRRYVDPADVACDYAEMDDKDQAFAWLDKAYAEKSNSMGYIKLWSQFDNLRSDPRYATLLKKMGLPQ
jgi:adenylate cyclase